MTATSSTVWTLFIGPFVGALLAFSLARMYDASRRFKERLAGANLVLLTLKNQYNDYLLFRIGFHQDCNRPSLIGDEPHWMLVRPNFMSYGEYEVDYERISYLFERGARTTVFDSVEECQIMHRHLIKVDSQRLETARTTQRLVAEKSAGAELTVQLCEQILGPALVAELDGLCGTLALACSDYEEKYLRAFRDLRAAALKDIETTWQHRLGYAFRFRHEVTAERMLVQLKAIAEDFATENLPPLPPSLVARTSTIRQRRPSKKPVAVPA